MADLRCQGIYVDNDNDPAPENIPDPENIPAPGSIPLTKLEDKSWISEGIICLRRSKYLHNTNTDFNNYTREELIKMMKLKFFLILFPVDYLK